MSLNRAGGHEDRLSDAEAAAEWGLVIHLPTDATMADFFLAVRLCAGGNKKVEADFYATLKKLIGKPLNDSLLECQRSFSKARSLNVRIFFSAPRYVREVPIRFDLAHEAWEQTKERMHVSLEDGSAYGPEEDGDDGEEEDDDDDSQLEEDLREAERLDFPDLHLPAKGATVFDFYQALADLDGEDAMKVENYVSAEIIDLIGEQQGADFVEMEFDEERAKATLLADFFGDDIDEFPFVFDGQKNVPRMAEDVRTQVASVLTPGAEALQDPKANGYALLKAAYPDMNPKEMLPTNDAWLTIAMKRLPALETIAEARTQGIPEQYIQKYAYSMTMMAIDSKRYKDALDIICAVGAAPADVSSAFARLADAHADQSVR
jgi:hypothetical protein